MYRFIVILTVITVVHGFGRIVGGNDANIKDHNYQVSVEYENTHFRGGALVKSNIVLTSASYLSSKQYDLLSVRAGSSIAEKGGDVLSVSGVIIHPKHPYDPNAEYNVALLMLSGSFQLKQEIGIIKLIPKGAHIMAGTIGTVTGWGALHYTELNTERLQSIQLPYVPLNICEYPFGEVMSCWGYFNKKQKDVCMGDQGGPLVIQDQTKDVVLAAIVSYDIYCGYDIRPTRFTDVTYHEIHDFISKYI